MFEQYSQAAIQKIIENLGLLKHYASSYESLCNQFEKHEQTVKVLRNDDDIEDKKHVISPLSQNVDFMDEDELEELLAYAEEHARLINNNLHLLKDYFEIDYDSVDIKVPDMNHFEDLDEMLVKIENSIAVIEDNLFEFEEIVH